MSVTHSTLSDIIIIIIIRVISKRPQNLSNTYTRHDEYCCCRQARYYGATTIRNMQLKLYRLYYDSTIVGDTASFLDSIHREKKRRLFYCTINYATKTTAHTHTHSSLSKLYSHTQSESCTSE